MAQQPRVIMRHPDVAAPASVPLSAVPIHRKSGWETDDDVKAKSSRAKTTKPAIEQEAGK